MRSRPTSRFTALLVLLARTLVLVLLLALDVAIEPVLPEVLQPSASASSIVSAAPLGPERYVPPVDAPVVRGFDVGPGPYAAGNRGLDYATTAGTPVRAVASGTVVFAGPVAGRRWVTVLHPDGLRSSLGPLRTTAVGNGDAVRRGDVVGSAAGELHLGIRRGETYLDPATLFVRRGPARLVPVGVGSRNPTTDSRPRGASG